MNEIRKIQISTDYIKLDSFLKFTGITSTGGEGKNLVENGEIYVNNEVCFQRGKKIYPGDEVKFEDTIFKVYK
jgi:ribosome-associated protein